MNRNRRKQSGDTIVEVLISLVVIAAILAGAFTLSQASTKNVRSSEERTQALNLLQGQIEQLRAVAPDHLANDFNNDFCLSGTTIKADTDSSCRQSYYSISIHKVTSASSPDPASGTVTFVATATWDGVDGAQKQAQLQYKTPVKQP